MHAGKLIFKFGPLVDDLVEVGADVVDLEMPPLPPSFTEDGNGPVKGFEFMLRATCTITDVMFDRLLWLSLIHGRRVTNNWLKMHGGVMTRKAWEKRKTRS